jgi:hypothetical protein
LEHPEIKIWVYGFPNVRLKFWDSKIFKEILRTRCRRHCREATPVSLHSSKFLLTLSSRRVSCSVVQNLGRNKNCSPRGRPRLFTSLKTLVRIIFSINVATISSRPMGLQVKGNVESFPCFRLETHQRVSVVVRTTASGVLL